MNLEIEHKSINYCHSGGILFEEADKSSTGTGLTQKDPSRMTKK